MAAKQGSALSAAPIAVGPTAGATPGAADARLAFSGPHVAPCSYVNAAGVEVSELCGDGMVTVTAQYYQVRCFGEVAVECKRRRLGRRTGSGV